MKFELYPEINLFQVLRSLAFTKDIQGVRKVVEFKHEKGAWL
jgi:hypothetical protein